MSFFSRVFIPACDGSFYTATNGFVNWIFPGAANPARLAYKNLFPASKKVVEELVTTCGDDWLAVNVACSELEKEHNLIPTHDLHRALEELDSHGYIEIISVIGNKFLYAKRAGLAAPGKIQFTNPLVAV